MDVVVTVPKHFGLDTWIAEGDPAGTAWSGKEWHFYLGGALPRIQPGERVYVVYHSALRGYASLVRIDGEGGRYALVRHGEAVAVSIPEPIPGFQGFRYRWWDRAIEEPFPAWQDPDAALFERSPDTRSAQLLTDAAALLVEMAGPEPVHIEMSARGPKKYYDVHRSLTERDARAHLAGRSTRGATLRHPGGMTRALCYDADTPDDWLRLVEAAWRLAECGYRPLVEASPAQDGKHAGGGHLWIIYTTLVCATWAHRHAVQIAPRLSHIKECWPGESGHNVRLPGGLYVQPGVRAWCKLYDAQGRLLSADGAGAARVLLDWQTPAEIVPAFPDAEPVGETGELTALLNNAVAQRAVPASFPNASDSPGVDQQWQHKYGRSLWFQFTPAMLSTWYNERTQVEDLLPSEKNGMGLASWHGERTASVGLRAEGWVDFGASARRADGKQDGGDAPELHVHVTQEAKPEVMRQIARQLVREAREAMERAAWRGEQPPTWVQPFMTKAGWQHYHALRAEAAHAATHKGVAGFHPPSEQAHMSIARAKQRPAAEAAGEDVAGQEVIPAELAPQERAEEPHAQRPPRGPDHIEVAHAIFAYARRIGYPRLHIGDSVIEAGRGWMGFVYSPKVTWEQRLQVYQ